MRVHRIVMAAILSAALGACGGGGSGSRPIAPANSGTTLTSSINSAQTGFDYDLDIWLPPGYAQGTVAYPVVYATDCEYRFDVLTAVLEQKAAQGTPLILVNVCAGSSDRRWVDFTMPGAAAYFKFLTLELIPSMDATYRTNPSNRILSGHSLSGEFAMYALYLENPAHRYFTSIVSEEGSFWFDDSMVASDQLALPAAMEQTMHQGTGAMLPINLVMAGDTNGNEPHVVLVYDLISGQQFQGLRIVQPVYSLGHVGMDGPAFGDALTFIFPGP